MAYIKGRCHSCRSEFDVRVGQAVYDRNLVWNSGYSCSFCGNGIEEDGRGPAPDEIRRAILDQEGEWALAPSDPGTRITTALKALRQALGLPLKSITDMRQRLPGPLVTGTKAEMEWLASILMAERLQSVISSVPTSDAK